MAKKRGATRFLRPTLCVLLLLFQCGKKDAPSGVEVTITADETTVTFLASGGDYEVKITSSGDWNVKEEIAWLEAKNVDNTTLKVSCQKNEGEERSGKVTATIEGKSAEITVKQKADTAPSFGEKTIADQTYLEHTLIPAQFLPEATGGNGTLTYNLTKQDGSALPAWLMFTADTRLLEGTTPAAAVGAEAYIYKVTDSDGDTDELTFMITVEADVTPTFGAETITDQTYVISSSINIPALPAATSGNGTLTYSLTKQDGSTLPAWLMFAEDTRMLSGMTPAAAVSAEAYIYKVTDKDGDTDELTFMITVEADVTPTFGEETITDQTYVINNPINIPALPVATGGNGTLTYSLTKQDGSALPAWLMFAEETRMLSGMTPAMAVGAEGYIYKVTDSDGDTDELTFMIAVDATDLMPAFANGASINDTTFVENSPIMDVTLPAATGGNGTLTYSLTPALPNGLSLTGRVLSGTPEEGTAASAAAYTYTATDSDGDEATLTFMITIEDDLMPTFSGTLVAQIYTVGAAITAFALPGATGGNGDLTYSLTEPAGMTFTAADRMLSGTPNTAAGATDYTLIATDEDGDTDDFVFSVTVRAANETPITLNSETLNVTATSTSDATTMLTSSVPWEATESSTGDWISAVAPTTGTGTGTAKAMKIDYTANTGAERTGTVTFTETTEGADPKFSVELSITQAADPEPTFGSKSVAAQVYTESAAITAFALPSASGGNGTLTYSLTKQGGGALPTWLTFTAATRMLSGTPTAAAGATNYTLTVRETDGDTDELTFSVTVRAASAVMMTLSSETLEDVTASSTSDATTTITSTVAWEAAASVGWITDVDPDMGTGTNTANAITLTYTQNPGAERTGMVTFTETTAGVNPKISVTLTVTQVGAVPAGLIPITTLEQLNAMRYDRNADGKVDDAGGLANTTLAEEAYEEVFPNVVYESGNITKYTGYELANDLNFAGGADSYSDATTNKPKWTSGEGWLPIGTSPNFFTGMFDGGGNTISNLYINRSRGDIGLFGTVTIGAVQIQNVGLVSPNVTGGQTAQVGGLVGVQGSGTISNCYVSGGSITGGAGRNAFVGGLVGQQNSGTISNCYVSGGSSTVGSENGAFVGGLVGHQLGGTISTCYVKGRTIEGGDNAAAGGLVGDQGGTIRACYVSNITVTVTEGGGGVAGSLVGDHFGGTLIACYAGGTGKIYTNLRGKGSGTVTNSYNQKSSSSGNNKTETELKAKTNANAYNSGSIYEDWDDLDGDGDTDSETFWDFGDTAGGAYPKLKVDFDGNGTATVSEFGSQ